MKNILTFFYTWQLNAIWHILCVIAVQLFNEHSPSKNGESLVLNKTQKKCLSSRLIIEPNKSFNGLQSYYQCIISKYPKFTTIEMLLPQYDYRVNPWSSWNSNSCPEWWTYGYNKIKHNRIQHQTAPSLERAIGAVAGLQAILLYSYRLRYTDFSIPSSFNSKLIHEVNIGEDYVGDAITKQWILPDDK